MIRLPEVAATAVDVVSVEVSVPALVATDVARLLVADVRVLAVVVAVSAVTAMVVEDVEVDPKPVSTLAAICASSLLVAVNVLRDGLVLSLCIRNTQLSAAGMEWTLNSAIWPRKKLVALADAVTNGTDH